jgi:hypothetical protein
LVLISTFSVISLSYALALFTISSLAWVRRTENDTTSVSERMYLFWNVFSLRVQLLAQNFDLMHEFPFLVLQTIAFEPERIGRTWFRVLVLDTGVLVIGQMMLEYMLHNACDI